MEINKNNLRSFFLGVAGCIVLYWVLHETDRLKGIITMILGILSPFLVGAAIEFILNVPMRAIENGLKGIKKA